MTTNPRVATVTVLLALLAAGCSDFATAPTRQPAEFRMTPDTVVVSEGETVQFQYTVLDEDGVEYESIPSWAAPQWTYSDASIFSVDVTGLGEALGPGEVEAVADLAGLQADALVRVNPSELGVSVAFAHLTQSTQRVQGDVPLVAGRPGLLRVYLQGDETNFFRPTVAATFLRNGQVVHAAEVTSEAPGLPERVEVGERGQSFEVPVPGSVLQPGTSLTLEIDPEGVIPATPGSTLRVPETGSLPLDVRAVRPFHVRLVPITQSLTGQTSLFESPSALDRMILTEAVFPLGAVDVDIRAPYTTDLDLNTTDGWRQLIRDVWTLRVDDGSPRYYYGGFRLPSRSPYAGLGFLSAPVSIGTDGSQHTLAHELGHNLSLPHAPCSPPDVDISGVDSNYPYLGASIGQWGWDRTGDRMLDPDRVLDLMSYCDPAWISDYNYERVIAYRDTSSYDAAFEPGVSSPSPREDVLIVHAGVVDGALELAPALEAHAPAVMPARGGRYTLEGLDGNGAVVFTLSFEPRPLGHGDHALFSAAIPAAVARPDRLAVLRVTGPEGAAERRSGPGTGTPGLSLEDRPGPAETATWDARRYPLAVVRDRATGRIVAIGHDGRLDLPGDADGLEVTLSDGVRSFRAELPR